MRKKVIRIIKWLVFTALTVLVTFNIFHSIFNQRKDYSEEELRAHDNGIPCSESVNELVRKCHEYRYEHGKWPDALIDLEGKKEYHTFNGAIINYDKEICDLDTVCGHGGIYGHGFDLDYAYSTYWLERVLLIKNWF